MSFCAELSIPSKKFAEIFNSLYFSPFAVFGTISTKKCRFVTLHTSVGELGPLGPMPGALEERGGSDTLEAKKGLTRALLLKTQKGHSKPHHLSTCPVDESSNSAQTA